MRGLAFVGWGHSHTRILDVLSKLWQNREAEVSKGTAVGRDGRMCGVVQCDEV